jgi:glycosyltransferase involved in cell wall biosynthesis
MLRAMDATESPALTVIVPAYNNGVDLDQTLRSLTRQTLAPEQFQVVVGDDGSAEPLAPIVEAYADRLDVTCVRADRNGGRAANRNRAASRANGSVLLFIDSDSPAHPRLIERHLTFHANRQFGPGVLLGKRCEADWAGAEVLQQGKTPEPSMVSEYRDDTREPTLGVAHRQRDFCSAPWVYAFTHNASVDRASFEAVGGFDEDFVTWGCEDQELFYRIFHRHGGSPTLFEYDRAAMVYHLPHYRSWRELGKQMRDNAEYFYRKHRRYDVEILGIGSWGHVVGRITWYDQALNKGRAEGLGRAECTPASVRADIAGSRALLIGYGVSALERGAGSFTFDHDVPPGPTNYHLLGLRMPFDSDSFDVVVNLDLWRFLAPDDLGTLVAASLTVASELRLVATSPGPDSVALLPVPFIGNPGQAVEMLRPHFDLGVSHAGEVTVLTLRQQSREPARQQSREPARCSPASRPTN